MAFCGSEFLRRNLWKNENELCLVMMTFPMVMEVLRVIIDCDNCGIGLLRMLERIDCSDSPSLS